MSPPPFHLHRSPSGLELAYTLHGSGPRRAIFLHGHPGSRHQAAFLEPYLNAHSLTVLSFDRPGYGNSSPERLRPNPLHLAAEMGSLADAAGFDRFHLIAVSGGAPYAINALPSLGSRVISAQIVCGLGPLRDPECRAHFPLALLLVMQLALHTPSPLLHSLVQIQLKRLRRGAGKRPPFLSPADFELLAAPEVRSRLWESLEAAFRQGVEGSKRDLKAFLSPWEAKLAPLSCPVTFHHGLDDRLVPWQFSQILASRIPKATFVPYENEGHYTLPLRRTREILEAIPQ